MKQADRLNETGRDAILAETDQKRRDVLFFAHKAVVLFLGIDKINIQKEHSEGIKFGYFVLAEMLDRPKEEPRMALALRLESPVVEGEPRRNSLTILHPVPEEVDFSSEDFEPADLPSPDVVYFVHEKDGVVAHIAVGQDTVSYYVPSDVDSAQTDEFDAIDDIFAGVGEKIIQSGLPFLALLHEDLINMSAVPAPPRNVFDESAFREA